MNINTPRQGKSRTGHWCRRCDTWVIITPSTRRDIQRSTLCWWCHDHARYPWRLARHILTAPLWFPSRFIAIALEAAGEWLEKATFGPSQWIHGPYPRRQDPKRDPRKRRHNDR